MSDKGGFSFKGLLLIIGLGVLGLFIIPNSCFQCSKEKKPGTDRSRDDIRLITIINKTNSRITGYMVSTASGAEIQRGKTNEDSFEIRISNSFNSDSQIEVVLIDRAGRIFSKNFEVPLKGNKDTIITRGDRKSEGIWKDKWKDFVYWMNENK